MINHSGPPWLPGLGDSVQMRNITKISMGAMNLRRGIGDVVDWLGKVLFSLRYTI